MKKVFTIFMLCMISQVIFGVQLIRVKPKQSLEEASHSYFVELLQMILNNTEKEYGKALVKTINVNMTQGRSLQELESGSLIDVDWAGTTIEREKKLETIRIPLIGGLLGYRIPVIRKEDKSKFDKIKTLKELKKLIAISGLQWPDSDILEASGFNVLRVPKTSQMYSMLENDRADYFPRSLSEVYGELSLKNNPKLIIYDKILLYYKFPMYFFTNKKDTYLAQRIEKGLMIALNNGTLLALIKNHPVTSPIFPLNKYKDSKIFEISNPILPKETPLSDKKLWIKLK